MRRFHPSFTQVLGGVEAELAYGILTFPRIRFQYRSFLLILAPPCSMRLFANWQTVGQVIGTIVRVVSSP
jgi:hypothetical protein